MLHFRLLSWTACGFVYYPGLQLSILLAYFLSMRSPLGPPTRHPIVSQGFQPCEDENVPRDRALYGQMARQYHECALHLVSFYSYIDNFLCLGCGGEFVGVHLLMFLNYLSFLGTHSLAASTESLSIPKGDQQWQHFEQPVPQKDILEIYIAKVCMPRCLPPNYTPPRWDNYGLPPRAGHDVKKEWTTKALKSLCCSGPSTCNKQRFIFKHASDISHTLQNYLVG